jgi:hypothetical protein
MIRQLLALLHIISFTDEFVVEESQRDPFFPFIIHYISLQQAHY